MKDVHREPGRIEENAAGFGLASEDELEKRAREIAVIRGRSAFHVTEEDRDAARRELLGETEHDPEDEELVAGTRSFDQEPGTSGHQAPVHLPTDEASVGERLVQEGMDEALHDEMLEAHKKNIDAAS